VPAPNLTSQLTGSASSGLFLLDPSGLPNNPLTYYEISFRKKFALLRSESYATSSFLAIQATHFNAINPGLQLLLI